MEILSISIIVIAVVVVTVFLHFVPLFLWFSALVSGVKISLIQLVLMRIRNVPPKTIVDCMITATKAGLTNIARDDLEALYMSGGHVTKVVRALVSATKANIPMTYEQAAAIDLAGRDVLDAVQTSVNPKVIDTPAVEAVAKDGIQVIVKARITVRSDINKLVGGAGEETVLARVGECIVTSIGSADTHEEVMENPDNISKLVMEKGLDSGTAFEILSVDIADVDLGKNVGAGLQIERANADRNIAQAKAEERRAMAIAQEQEMKANKIKAEAEDVLAEAKVPLALAKALESGNMGFVDYYKLKNLQADSAMRESFANGGEEHKVKPVIDVNNDSDSFFK